MFQENICRTIEENEETFHKFGSWRKSLGIMRFDIPGPANFSEATSPSTKSQDSIPEENSTLDKVCKAAVNFGPFLYLKLVTEHIYLGSARKTYEKTTICDKPRCENRESQEKDYSIYNIICKSGEAQKTRRK